MSYLQLKAEFTLLFNGRITYCLLQDLLSEARCHGNKRLDLFYYRLAKDGDLPATAKKRLMERCVHVNPSEQLFWTSLKEYN